MYEVCREHGAGRESRRLCCVGALAQPSLAQNPAKPPRDANQAGCGADGIRL